MNTQSPSHQRPEAFETRLASRALYRQRHVIAANAERLRALFDAAAGGSGDDLSFAQWTHLYALALEFKPDLIIELGRKIGNSTCVFTQAAQDLPGCQVKSLCLSDEWRQYSWPRVRQVVSPDWVVPLDAREVDITAVDFNALSEGATRILVFWDAHGIEVADAVLARLMPAIAERPHIVAMHDISDARHCGSPGGYHGLPFWRGQEGCWAGQHARLRLGWIDTVVEQAIPVVDFLSRNGLELNSADQDVHLDIVCKPEILQALRDDVPEDCFATVNHWAYFTLNDAPGPLAFPRYGDARSGNAGGMALIGRALSQDLEQVRIDTDHIRHA